MQVRPATPVVRVEVQPRPASDPVPPLVPPSVPPSQTSMNDVNFQLALAASRAEHLAARLKKVQLRRQKHAELFLARLKSRSEHIFHETGHGVIRSAFDCVSGYRRKVRMPDPMRRALHEIQMRYGAGVLLFFGLARWLTRLNTMTFVLWLALAITPWFMYWDEHESTAGVQEMLLNVIGVRGSNTTDDTCFMYSGYPPTLGSYDMAAAWTAAVLSSYFIGLWMIIGDIGERVANVASDQIPLNGDGAGAGERLVTTLYGWEWDLTQPQGVESRLLGTWVHLQALFGESLRFDLKQRESIAVKSQGFWNMRRRRSVKRFIGLLVTLVIIAAALYAVLQIVNHKESLDSHFTYLSSLIVTAIIAGTPFIIEKIVSLEEWHNPQTVVQQEVLRTYVCKIAVCVVVVLSLLTPQLKSLGADGEKECAEYVMGSFFQQLLLLDMGSNIVTVVLQGYLPMLVSGWQQQEATVSTDIINAFYRQALVWIGMPYSPLIPFTGMVSSVIVFYVKRAVMTRTCRTPANPLSEVGSSFFFQVLLLVTLIISMIPTIFFFLQQTVTCGPHAGSEPILSISSITSFNSIARWIFSRAVLSSLLVIFVVALYIQTKLLLASRRRVITMQNDCERQVRCLRESLQVERSRRGKPRGSITTVDEDGADDLPPSGGRGSLSSAGDSPENAALITLQRNRWTCYRCSYVNSLANTECLSCGLHRLLNAPNSQLMTS